MRVNLRRLRTAVSAALLAGALALVPAAAQAKSGQGAKCGKGHAKHQKAVGKACAKSHDKAGTTSPSRTAAPQPRPTTSPRPADATTGPVASMGHTNNPAQQCRAEQHADAAAFAQAYGGDRHGGNAFGTCVAQKSAAQGDADGADSGGAGAPDPADTPGS